VAPQSLLRVRSWSLSNVAARRRGVVPGTAGHWGRLYRSGERSTRRGMTAGHRDSVFLNTSRAVVVCRSLGDSDRDELVGLALTSRATDGTRRSGRRSGKWW